MTTDLKKSTDVKCPHCGNAFSPEAVLEKDVRKHLELEYEKKMEERTRLVEQRTKKTEEERYHLKIRSIENDRQEKTTRLHELEKQSVLFEERVQKLNEREQNSALELRKKMLTMEKDIIEKAERNAAEKAHIEIREKENELERRREILDIQLKQRVHEETEKAREQERMRVADLQKKLDDQTKLVNEMKRKTEQGSMQEQGEVQEVLIEDYLTSTFRRDRVEEVAKGKKGGDCIQHVIDAFGNTCGRILYESKRTRNFGSDWTMKLKEDMRLTQADFGVIVTEVMPNNMPRFGLFEGVWVCTFPEFKALSFLLRDALLRIGEVKAFQENKGDKMQMLYNYLTSNDFHQKLDAIVEAFQQMQSDLIKEKNQTMARWAKQEKTIFKVMENSVSMYGDVRGIAGTAIKEIPALEEEEVRKLIA